MAAWSCVAPEWFRAGVRLRDACRIAPCHTATRDLPHPSLDLTNPERPSKERDQYAFSVVAGNGCLGMNDGLVSAATQLRSQYPATHEDDKDGKLVKQLGLSAELGLLCEQEVRKVGASINGPRITGGLLFTRAHHSTDI